jgi:diguanylate cyclase (GGDEF)-like protein
MRASPPSASDSQENTTEEIPVNPDRAIDAVDKGMHSRLNILAILSNRSQTFWLLSGIMGVVLVGVADYFTGREIAFSSFYLIPIMLVTWYTGRTLGVVISIASAIAWFTADTWAGQAYSMHVIPYWNTAVRLSFFVIVTFLLPALKGLENERKAARLDDLTGAANRRNFFEVAQAELDRSLRYQHPFSVLYFDIDDFKAVNDRMGHQAGDQLLCSVVHKSRQILRKIDLLARLGGDEFIILLSETGPQAAKVVVSKLQESLLEEMKSHAWPVTFSIGVLTCLDAHLSLDEMMRKADDLMYAAKKNGKNAIVFATYAGKTAPYVPSVGK